MNVKNATEQFDKRNYSNMQISTYSLLVAAYLIVWLAIFFYLARLQNVQAQLSREIEDLKSKLPAANSEAVEQVIPFLGDRNLLPQQRL